MRKWWQRSGEHCRVVHEHIIGRQTLDLRHVQADEIKVKRKGGYVWMAMAMMVSIRLWLGRVVSTRRDLHLIQALAQQIRRMALCRELLLAVDGLTSYVKAFRRAFRTPFKGKGRGRPRLIAWPHIAIVQVVKQRKKGLLHIERRIVQGSQDILARLLQTTQGGGVINTRLTLNV